jgi:glycosyltransferase involved in cell wall biosynthesis
MKNNLVSVVVANFNNATYLKQTLLSIQNQSYKNIQLIIVDDGSKDESVNIVQEFVNNNNRFAEITFINLEENVGSGFAKAKGLEKVIGEYCCFIDSDDLITLDAIQILVDIIANNKDLAMVYTNAIKIDANVPKTIKALENLKASSTKA